MSNIRDYQGTAAGFFAARISGKIPVWRERFSLNPAAAFEYALRQGDKSSSQSELHFSHATFTNLGLNIAFTGNPLGKDHYIEFGAGIGQRLKMQESNYWDIQPQGGFPTLFPDRARLFPAFFQVTSVKKKFMLHYRLDLALENLKTSPEGFTWKFNTIAAGIGISWLSSPKKVYYKGTHRTLQWDDIWHNEE